MKKLLALNWKMNPATYESAERLASASADLAAKLKKYEVVICPPLPWLDDLATKFRGKVKLGSQDVFWEEKGAYTGEVSPVMLKKSGVAYVIVGHSERRRILQETDEMVNKKVLAGLKFGLKVILCVGEDIKIRRQGKKAVKNFVYNQIKKDLKSIHDSKFAIHNSLVIAYEPIWAIGTGTPCHPEDALKVIKFIREFLTSDFSLPTPRVLYGGSVTGKNILDFVKYKEIDGALVGGASLNPSQFKTLI